jgi:hypothetical protein
MPAFDRYILVENRQKCHYDYKSKAGKKNIRPEYLDLLVGICKNTNVLFVC